jgi:hypothetical protein
VIAALVGVAAPSEAGEQCWCEPGTPNAGMEVPCDGGGCLCFNSCGDGGSGSAGGSSEPFLKPLTAQDKLQASRVALKFLWLYGVGIAPGLATEWLWAGRYLDGETLGRTHAQARHRWRELRARIAADEALGRKLARARVELAVAERAAERAPEAPASFAWNAPELVPSTPFRCDKARIELPLGHEWPIAGFANFDELCDSCPCNLGTATVAPSPEDKTCPAETFACTGYDVCCPREYPIYNPCDTNCYRTSEFGLSPEAAARCGHYLSCKGGP